MQLNFEKDFENGIFGRNIVQADDIKVNFQFYGVNWPGL